MECGQRVPEPRNPVEVNVPIEMGPHSLCLSFKLEDTLVR